MKKRMAFVAGASTLLITGGVAIGTYTAVNAQPNEGSQLPSIQDVAAKLDAVSSGSSGGSTAARQAPSVSGEGPVPQVLESQNELFQDTEIVNTVLGVAADGPNRAVATRTIRYLLPNGDTVQTDPGTVPFVLEADGEWRVDREFLCRQVRMIEGINQKDGFAAEPDPGCA